ncbi:hypothetical protein DFH06DRAFT_449120 [Mycena polygramma]|nr:hypothetical protein DFH06DRAFT_449120 [Mycena polygramma]
MTRHPRMCLDSSTTDTPMLTSQWVAGALPLTSPLSLPHELSSGEAQWRRVAFPHFFYHTLVPLPSVPQASFKTQVLHAVRARAIIGMLPALRRGRLAHCLWPCVTGRYALADTVYGTRPLTLRARLPPPPLPAPLRRASSVVRRPRTRHLAHAAAFAMGCRVCER